MDSSGTASMLVQLMPLLLMGCLFGGIMAWAASKLGRSKLLWFVLGFIPGVNFIFLWVAAWAEIIRIAQRVTALEQRLSSPSKPS